MPSQKNKIIRRENKGEKNTISPLIYSITYFSIVLFLLTACGVDGQSTAKTSNSAILSWQPPTTNVDGTELTDLAGFKIYSGKASRVYGEVNDIGNPDTTELTIENLAEGTYYFAATAYDISGNESEYSNEVSKTIK